VAHNPSAQKVIPIGHDDPQLVAAERGEAESGHRGALQKIMGGAGVEESQEARALEHHGHDHHVLHTNAHECMERDHTCSGRSDVLWRQVVVWRGVWCSVDYGVLLHVEVTRLQVEEPLALAASDIGLVAVEA
jgi:hypothetical protein